MFCPFCDADDTKVIDSRLVSEGRQVRRRRECCACKERFTSYETAELLMPYVIKEDGRRTPFDMDKLRSGMQKALERRPVSVENMEAAIGRIMHRIRQTGEREVSSNLVGQQVMDELRSMDQVAYVRFASVYRSFQDVDEFKTEIERLRTDTEYAVVSDDQSGES